MAFALTYNTLFNNVLTYLERNDTSIQNAIPGFILFAQRRLARDLKSLVTEQYVTGTLQTGVPILQKPGQWLNSLTMNVGSNVGTDITFSTRNQIPLRTYEYCRELWPNDTSTAFPEAYADYGYENWLISPTPDQNYPMEVAYLGFPAPLDANNQTNMITEYAPDALNYATLIEAMIFVKNYEQIQFYEQRYQQAIGPLLEEDKRRYVDRYTTRSSD